MERMFSEYTLIGKRKEKWLTIPFKKSSDTCFAKQESEVKNKTADRKSFIFLGFNAYKESLNSLRENCSLPLKKLC